MMDTQDGYKVYVSATVDFRDDGLMLPRKIIWEDGTSFQIDRVLDVRPGFAAKAGGQGDRYTVEINGCRTSVFFERAVNLTGETIGRWFVERRIV